MHLYDIERMENTNKFIHNNLNEKYMKSWLICKLKFHERSTGLFMKDISRTRRLVFTP